MKKHIKKAWNALKTRRAVIIILAVLVIVYGTLVIVNVVNSDAQVLKLVSAARPDGGDTFVLGKDTAFENKILEFLKVDKLCAVTEDQATILKQTYTFETKEYYIVQEAKTVFVLYVDGPKANLAQIERAVGSIDDGNCQVVHGSKMIALLAPVSI